MLHYIYVYFLLSPCFSRSRRETGCTKGTVPRGFYGASHPKLLFAGRLLRASSFALPPEPNMSFESQLVDHSEGVVDWC
jgi:hypothetical protein